MVQPLIGLCSSHSKRCRKHIHWCGYKVKHRKARITTTCVLWSMMAISRRMLNLWAEKQLPCYRHKDWGPCMPRAVGAFLLPCGRACLRWNQMRESRTNRCSKADPEDLPGAPWGHLLLKSDRPLGFSILGTSTFLLSLALESWLKQTHFYKYQ